jgi:hypothetical protein
MSGVGSKSVFWKGGRIKTRHGYIQVWVDHTDPLYEAMARARPSSTSGYVLEHRLVMARSLGRPLLRHETPHHKNGNKSDNRLKKGHEFGGCPTTCCNLELWTVSQPAGQRVADKLTWAKEILRLYA